MKALKLAVSVLFSLLSAAAAAQGLATGSITLMGAAALTAATVNSSTIPNLGARGGHFIFTTTAYSAGTYTAHIQGQDPASGNFYDVLIATGSNVISGNGTVVLKVAPGVGAIAGGATNDFLPSVFRVQLIGAASQSMTIGVGFNYIK